ncbi:MAG: MATE family efflux transporter, partial [Planctomycetes bacterium]|nr:MATE family efflux transporter [Planctomycetota bacterium]
MADAPPQNLSVRPAVPGGYRELLRVALPLVLSMSATTLQHFVDRMFLTWWKGPPALAAAFPAGLLNFAMLSIFIGTASYASTFVAQYHGAGRPERIGPAIWQGLWIALIGGVALLAIRPFSE